MTRFSRPKATGAASKHRAQLRPRRQPTRAALILAVVVGFGALTLVLVHGTNGGRSKSEVDFHRTNPSASPSITLTPLMKYRRAETTAGILYAGVQDDEVDAAIANTCYNSLDQMKKYVHTVRLFNKNNPGKYRDTLVDHALFISAYCPAERLEYDRAVRDEAPNLVALPAD